MLELCIVPPCRALREDELPWATGTAQNSLAHLYPPSTAAWPWLDCLQVDRYAVSEMVCMECATRQPVAGEHRRSPPLVPQAAPLLPLQAQPFCGQAPRSPVIPRRPPLPLLLTPSTALLASRSPPAHTLAASCTACNASMAGYYCPICHLFDDQPGRHIYHCPFCNFCRQVAAGCWLHSAAQRRIRWQQQLVCCKNCSTSVAHLHTDAQCPPPDPPIPPHPLPCLACRGAGWAWILSTACPATPA